MREDFLLEQVPKVSVEKLHSCSCDFNKRWELIAEENHAYLRVLCRIRERKV